MAVADRVIHKIYTLPFDKFSMSRTKHDFPDRFFAVVRDKDNDKDIVYGEKGKKFHNHIRLKIDGIPLFHRVRDEYAGITWECASITDVGLRLKL